MNICKNIVRKFSLVRLSAETSKFPLCKDCKFFISDKNTSIGKCKNFGSLDLVTGEIQYAYAAVSRVNSHTNHYVHLSECGQKGLLFQNKNMNCPKV